MKRETIREKTMQLVYQMDLTGDFSVDSLSLVDENVKAASKEQSVELLSAIQEHHEEIDELIKNNLEKWDFERIAKTDLAILRTALAEMLYLDEIPVSVSINEAVNLAKEYGDERSYAFVNSVLSKIAKSIK